MFSSSLNFSNHLRSALRQGLAHRCRSVGPLKSSSSSKRPVRRRILVTAAKSTAAATGGVLAAGLLFTTAETSSPYESHKSNGGELSRHGSRSQELEEELPLVYEVEALNNYWRARPLEVVRRAVQVVTVLG